MGQKERGAKPIKRWCTLMYETLPTFSGEIFVNHVSAHICSYPKLSITRTICSCLFHDKGKPLGWVHWQAWARCIWRATAGGAYQPMGFPRFVFSPAHPKMGRTEPPTGMSTQPLGIWACWRMPRSGLVNWETEGKTGGREEGLK